MTRVNVKHVFAAPAARVHDAWLDCEKVRQFLFTTATGEVVRCDIDARVGGTFAIVDRRHDGEVLHEGTYLELERPHRLAFTLRVPRYSPDESRVTIEIEPREHGCELSLTTETPEAWAEDSQRGWAMILDVLDQILPADEPTCGGGLAQHAAVPRRMAIHLVELAQTLELHRDLLVLDDTRSQRENDVYRDLAMRYRDLAARLRETAEHMAAQRDLPMGPHDDSKWTETHTSAFARFVHEQGALASVVGAAAARDERMLASMQQKKPG